MKQSKAELEAELDRQSALLKKQAKTIEKLNVTSRKTRSKGRFVYVAVVGTALFFVIRYLMQYFDLIDSLTRQNTKH